MYIKIGPVVVGVVGNKVLRCCLFGEAMKTASCMEASGKRKIFLALLSIFIFK